MEGMTPQLRPQPGLVPVTGCPHPFRPARILDQVEAGATLEQIVTRGFDRMRVPESLRVHGHAWVADRYVPRELWASTVPAAGAQVVYRVVPMGGGDNKVLRSVLTLAIMAAAVVTQQYYLAAYGTTTVTAAGVTQYTAGSLIASGALAAGVSAVGLLAVNALLPVRQPSLPSVSSEKDSPTYSTSGARNILNPFGPVPALLGRHRITPPQGGKPYTEFSGGKQYVHQLFVLGYAPIALQGKLKLGETPLDDLGDVQYEYLAYADETTIPKYYPQDVEERQLSLALTEAAGWQTRVTDQPCDRFSIDAAFMRGLVEFTDTGGKRSRTVQLEARYRKQGDVDWKTLGGLSDVSAERCNLARAGSYTDTHDPDDREFVDGLQWWTVSVSPTAEIYCASGELDVDTPPAVPEDHAGVAHVRVYGNDVDTITYVLPEGASGFAITAGHDIHYSGSVQFSYQPYIDVAAGVMPLDSLVVTAKQTTAVTRTWSATPGERAYYEIAMRRVTPDTSSDQIMDEVWWTVMRAVKFEPPIRFNRPVSVVSVRIKATGKLNGPLDEVNVVAESECPDYDAATDTWISRPTSNPASLYRLVLQGNANARARGDASIDLDGLEAWHEYCRVNKFSYNRYHDFRSGVLDVLRDIALAGRAAVTRPDAKWGVVVDDPRTTVVQHITPNNSWGFSATRALTHLPHAWRVRFINELANWQNDERIVYADGYDEGTATEFEGLELPGVTHPDQIWKHGRHHLAVALLRPEEYEVFMDMEHIVCTRGDLVRCSHPVTLWGLSSGRVKVVDEPTRTLTVDTPCPMEEGESYNIRWRTAAGVSVACAVVTDPGDQTALELSGTVALPEPGDLWSFGPVGLETAELLVKHIEPGEHYSARLLLVDYSPAVFDASSGTIPAFESQITQPSDSTRRTPPVPVITFLRSDEAVLVRNPDGSLTSRICLAFALPSGADLDSLFVQVQYRETGAESWQALPAVAAEAGLCYVSPVEDGGIYDVRVRAVTGLGVAGAWSATQTHLVVGKTSPPPDVTGFAAEPVETGVYLSWDRSTALDVGRYVVRQGASWAAGTPVYDGKAVSVTLPLVAAGTYTYWVKAVDVVENESVTAASATLVTPEPEAPEALTATVEGADIALAWAAPVSMFPIVEYEVRRGSTWATAQTLGRIKGTGYRTPGPAVGVVTYWVAAVDAPGNMGLPASVGVDVTAPGSVTVTPTVIDNNVLLRWTAAPSGSFAVDEYEVRKGAAWDTAEPVGRLAGLFATVFEASAGSYTYWVAAVDLVGNMGAPAAATASVSAPPDYESYYDADSAFDGTLTNAFLGAQGLSLPVDAGETWAEHFTGNSWASPQDQINAGYPYYAEPTPSGGSYQEVVDCGAVLAATRILVTPTVETVHGSVTLTCQIEIRETTSDPWTALAAGWEAYGTSFRYMRYTITATPDGGEDDLALITRINVTMAGKLVHDAGTAACLASDSGGTQVVFNRSFTSVTAITVSVKSGGTARYALWNYTPGNDYFTIELYDATNNRASGDAAWSVKGV